MRQVIVLVSVGAFFAVYPVFAETTRSASADNKEEVERRRENLRAELDVRQAELTEKLSARNQIAASRMQSALAQRNTVFVAAYTLHLDRLEKIMAKIEMRSARAQEAGEDVTGLKGALQQARAAIEKARQAISEQEKKVYIVDLASSENVRQAKLDTFNQFRDDHGRVRDDATGPAREAVAQAFEALRDLLR